MPPASVFISYAHTDNESSDPSKRWLNRLLEHLELLNFQDQVHTSSDLDIEIGADWHSSIQMSLSNARAAVLLISPAFLASNYIRNSELPVLLKNALDKGLVIIPIILRPSLFKETLFKYPDPRSGPKEISLSNLQAANSPTKPLNSLKEHAQDEVLLSVAQRLLKIVQMPKIDDVEALDNLEWGITRWKPESTSQANSQVIPPSVEVEQELNESDREILTDLLIRSGRAEYSARKALCIKIGIEPNQLEFLRQPTDTDFALELISYLHNIGNKKALCKIYFELEVVFKGGKYSADLENIKSKLNCNNVQC